MTRPGWPSWVFASIIAIVLHVAALFPLETLAALPAETTQTSFRLNASDIITPLQVDEAEVVAAQVNAVSEAPEKISERTSADAVSANQQAVELGEREVSETGQMENRDTGGGILSATAPIQGMTPPAEVPIGEAGVENARVGETTTSVEASAATSSATPQSSNGEQSPEVKPADISERVQQGTFANDEAGVVSEETSSTATSPRSEMVSEQVAIPETAAREQSSADDGKNRLALVVRPDAKPPEPEQRPADAMQVIAGFPGGQCFHVVAAGLAGGQMQVTSYSAADVMLDAFEDHVKSSGIDEVVLQRRSIQSLQCAAIEFVHQSATSLQSTLAIELDQSWVRDGGEVSGRINGFAATWLYVLLVDDEGLAQDVSRYAAVSAGGAVLNMPVHVKGEGKVKPQLLMAIASDKSLTLLDDMKPQPLAAILPLIKGEIAASKASLQVAVTDFEVR